MNHPRVKAFFFSLVFAGLITSVAFESMAQQQNQQRQTRKKRDTGQRAIVAVDGSAIYQAPNFDAPVMEYLDRGKKILISQKLYKGIGGLGAFYKIRLRPRVYGYVTDVDVEITGKVKPRQRQQQTPVQQQQAAAGIPGDPTQINEDLMREEPTDTGPMGEGIYFTRYAGLTFQNLSYAEKINNKTESGSWSLLGFKMSGPGTIAGGMPLDIEVLVGTEAPSIYDTIASSTSGFAFIGHMMPMFPFIEDKRYVLYYSFGPMLRYSAFKVKLKNNTSAPDVDSQELAIGLNIGAGLGLALGKKWALRFDAKYTYENEDYTSLGAALQYKY